MAARRPRTPRDPRTAGAVATARSDRLGRAGAPDSPGVLSLAVVAVLLCAVTACLPGTRPTAATLLAVLPGVLVALVAALGGSPRDPARTVAPSRPVLRTALVAALAGLVASAAWVPVVGGGTWQDLLVLPARAGATMLVLVGVIATGWGARLRRPGPVRPRGLLAGGLAASLLGALLVVPAGTAAAATEPASPPSTALPCTAGQAQRSYAVSAVTVDVPFNRWGDTLPSARIFVLDGDVAAVRNWWRPLAADPATDPAGNRRLRPRPLVLRANEGECVQVKLTNRMSASAAHGLPASPRVGIQASGMVVDARTTGGAKVGFDADPTVAIGSAITYYWRVPAQEGLYLFQDMATPAGGEHDAGSRGVGLYGAVAVEPEGSTWTDPRSGELLSGTPGQPASVYKAVSTQSGELYVEADIHPPGAPSFRESVQLAQDEITGIGMGFNYGSEALERREQKACPDCVGEETWLSSWPYGDPAMVKLASGRGPWLPTGTGAGPRKELEDCGLPESCYVTNVFHAYTGDPTKIRFGLSGVKETHVFHAHAHQWLADPRGDALVGTGPGTRPESTTIDSQSFGPGEAYSAELLHGAGSKNGTFGDSIFHCHLYPHFAEGFWSLMRVHDVRLDGASATPDGVAVRPLRPLPGRAALPLPTADNPGFPGMIPGTYGYRAPQPPGSVTEGGADGTPARPAPRLVAGRPIADAKLALEQKVVAARNGGREAPLGAPYADPCPPGSRQVDYAVTVLQRDLVYNEAGHHDPQARVMVLTTDVAAVLAGTKKVEPLFMRVNAGDCINLALTNMVPSWTGDDAFQQLAQTNMLGGHVHLVKFDVTASDGGSNGWNYQQAAFSQDQAELTAAQASGEVACTPSATFYGGESSGCRLEDRATWTPPTDSAGMWGQTIHERWYADTELRTAFTHDHHFAALVQNHGLFGSLVVEPAGFDMRDPATGAYLQPVNDPAHGTPCGTRCSGDAVGEAVDLVGPGANDDYREFGLALADFVPLVKRGGDPRNPRDVVNPPGAPEAYPDKDPGTYAVNYRNAPLVERRQVNGTPVDPAHRFSSWVFGDPMTPLLQGYARDNVRLRVVQGSQEEQHLFQVHGLRWREEPDDPGSPLVGAQTIGISEAFNAEMPGFDCSGTGTACRGDYLYGGTSMDDLWNGMWGIMRVHGTQQPGLLSLPDNPARLATTTAAPAPRSRTAPPRATGPGTSCPTTAPVRAYDVVAMSTDLVYGDHGYHDPEGLLYVLAEDEAAVRAGTKEAEPLVLRANAGDCVKVSLRNALPASYGRIVNGVDGDPPLILEPVLGTVMGTRVSLHPQLVRHDVRLSDGAAVGFNPDSTAGIGQTVAYEWFADTELGATNLLDYGDVRGHRQHGLAAALVVEPQHATYHDPVTGAEVRSGTVADVRVPGQEDFREQVLVYQDGLDLRTASGAQVPDKKVVETGPEGPVVEIEPDGGDFHAGGHEDAGEKAVNYSTAPLHRRLGAAPGAFATGASSADWAGVFGSPFYGDPSTPVMRSYAGDQVRVRVLGGNRPRQTGFQLDGAVWRQEPYDVETSVVGVQGGIGTGKAVNAHVRLPAAGDHLWSSPTTYGLPDGVWGLARVYPRPADAVGFVPAARRSPDDPFVAGNAPLQLLERRSLVVGVFVDTDADGVTDPGEAPSAGTEVRLRTTSGATVLTARTAADGTAAFSPQAGVYDVQVLAPAGSTVGTTAGGDTERVDLTADGAQVRVAAGLVSRAPLRAVVFVDADADGTRDAGEAVAPGWTVGATGPAGSAAVTPAATGADGSVTFPGLVPGQWSVSVQPRAGWRTTTPSPVAAAVAGASVEVSVGVAAVDGVLVRPVDDVDGDGAVDPGERVLAGLLVETTPAGAVASTTRTGDDGAAVVTGGGAASVRVLRPQDGTPLGCSVAVLVPASDEAPTSVPCAADGTVAVPAGTAQVDLLGPVTDGVLSTRLFDDADRDGQRDAGEAPLADWPVVLVRGDGSEAVRATTDADGLVGALLPPGRYRVEPQAPVAAVPWQRTGAATEADVVRGGHAVVASGWVQPGSVSVGVFHDLDGDSRREDGDPPLGDRTVKLLSSTGALLATAYTDASGRAAFPVKAGTAYRVQVVLPTAWRATAPLVGATVQTTVPLTAPADGAQATVEVAHQHTTDRTPPPPPTASPGLGVLTAATTVTVSTVETGAVLRYTLDGTAPTATRGMVTTGAVRVSADRVLRAVAVDAAGNVSSVASWTYDLPWTGATAQLPASSWAVTTGGPARGGAAETASDDRAELAVASVPLAGRPTVDVTATVAVPASMRAAAAFEVSWSVRSTQRATRLRAQWFDVSTGTWRALHTSTQGLDETRYVVDLGAASKVVASDGTVKVRLLADVGQPFDLAVDQLVVTAVNRR